MTENVEEKKAQEPGKTEETAQTEAASAKSLEKSVEFTVSAAELKTGVDAALKRYAKKAKVAGFRPGHVPFETVRAMYGHDAYVDTLNDLVAREFEKAAEVAKLMMVGRPVITPLETKEGEDLKFKAVVECYPEFEIPSFEGLELKRYECPLTDAEVAKTIDVMRKQRAQYVEQADRKASDEDRCTINFKGTKDGVAFEGGTAENFVLTLGAGRMLPDFEKAVSGMGVGEKKTFQLTFPADYPAKELAGQQVDFDVEVLKIETPVLPELDDKFAKSVGQDNVDTLKQEVKVNLEREVKARLLSRTKVEVMDALTKLATFPAPTEMVVEEQTRLAQEAKERLTQFGLDPKKAPAMPLEMFKGQAQKRVVLGIFVSKLVEQEKLAATTEDVEKLATEIASSYENADKVKDWYLKDANQSRTLANVATETKVVEYVLGKAKTTQETVEFDKLMQL